MAYNTHGRTGWRNHLCGFYYNTPVHGTLRKTYLPQVELHAHTTILSTTSRTALTQTFVNPSTDKAIREVRYTFPLYDGVSVVGFTCHVGDRTIVGEVKEKEKARAVFNAAVARGETAGLFEQLPEASDVFTTTVGNIPPGEKLIVEITYLGELKHDMEVDGIRFTIPNIIYPRYGSHPGSLQPNNAHTLSGSGISITVDADMADGSFIKTFQSPSHHIAMTMGTTSADPDAEPTMTKASATLSMDTAELDKDFVLQIIAKNTGVPKAILETHPTIPNQRALMATLVPKFALRSEKPELVFICDRSGSMSGSNITLVIQALKVFLKSLPVGIKFNICSFGSSYSFLWEKSVSYSQQTLDEAIRHAESLTANLGGTEMLAPLRATIEQRYKDMPLDVILLTDGEVWNQHNLFDYLNQARAESKAPIRTFTLGIGNGVSHALIEGIAKAGNGFSQTVGQGEKMDTKVVRMLKGALSPHINDYTLEVKYANDDVAGEDDDDFEIVERVADSLKINFDLNETKEEEKKKPISHSDTSADPDKEEPSVHDETGEARYAHLPNIASPKVIQAPQNIPSLFAFNRTTVYLLLGPKAPTATPKSVVLRGTSAHGPLELEIPIQKLDQPSQTIHQLAAKKAIAELEQGRGWLSEAKDESGKLLKSKSEGHFEDMVEREAVRLGVQFQVGGKWCSFVAVDSNKANTKEKEKDAQDWEFLEDETPANFVNMNPQNYRKYTGFSSHSDSDSSDDSNTGTNRFLRDAGSDSEDGELSPQNVDHLVLTAMRRSSQSPGDGDGNGRASMDQASNPNLPTRMAYLKGAVTQSAAPQTQKPIMKSWLSKKSVGPSLDQASLARMQPHSVKSSSPFGQSSAPLQLYGASSASGDQEFGTSAPQAPSIWGSASRRMGSGSALFGEQPNVSNTSFGRPSQRQADRFCNYTPEAAPSRLAQDLKRGASPGQQSGNLRNVQDHQMQLMPLEQQNKKRLMMARQEQDQVVLTFTSIVPPLTFEAQLTPSPWALGGTGPMSSADVLQDYQMQLMTLNQDSKIRRRLGAIGDPQFGASTQPPAGGASFFGAPSPPPPPAPTHAADSDGVQMPLDACDFDLDVGDNAALENFDFDSFLSNPEDEADSETKPNSIADLKNFGSAKSKMTIKTGDLSAFANAEEDAMDEGWGAAPKGAGYSPTYSPNSPGFSPNSLSHSPVSPNLTSAGAASPSYRATSPQYSPVSPGLTSAGPASPIVTASTPEELTHLLISLQSFEGSWDVSVQLLASLQIPDSVTKAEAAKAGVDQKVLVTAMVAAVFEKKLMAFEGSWELVVEKAKGWLEGQVQDVDRLLESAGQLVK